MVCCAEDIQMIGFIVHYANSIKLKSGQWLSLQAKVHCEYDQQYDGIVPVLYCESLTDGQRIEDYVTFS